MDQNDITPVRTLRHQTLAHVAAVIALLGGEPGLSKEQQIERLDLAIAHLNEARDHLQEAKGIIANRDEQAHADLKAKIANSYLN